MYFYWASAPLRLLPQLHIPSLALDAFFTGDDVVAQIIQITFSSCFSWSQIARLDRFAPDAFFTGIHDRPLVRLSSGFYPAAL
jgi:hypothetical protein